MGDVLVDLLVAVAVGVGFVGYVVIGCILSVFRDDANGGEGSWLSVVILPVWPVAFPLWLALRFAMVGWDLLREWLVDTLAPPWNSGPPHGLLDRVRPRGEFMDRLREAAKNKSPLEDTDEYQPAPDRDDFTETNRLLDQLQEARPGRKAGALADTDEYPTVPHGDGPKPVPGLCGLQEPLLLDGIIQEVGTLNPKPREMEFCSVANAEQPVNPDYRILGDLSIRTIPANPDCTIEAFREAVLAEAAFDKWMAANEPDLGGAERPTMAVSRGWLKDFWYQAVVNSKRSAVEPPSGQPGEKETGR